MARLFVTLQYLLPHHLLCRLAYALTRSRLPWLKNLLIRRFVQHYRPQMSDALEPDPLRYESFNAFFTRALRPAARAVAGEPGRILCPCDGTVSLCGNIEAGSLLQAKGHRYSLEALLGGDRDWSARLAGGHFATLYLAPYDYHRVHMPLAGRLRAAWHVPGRLFSVNAATAARVPGLFARNERVVCAFEGEYGCFAVILVGALFVGSMSTVWHGEITPWRDAGGTGRRGPALAPAAAPAAAHTPWGVHRLHTPQATGMLARGAELGRFNMGSTVILLLPAGGAHWDETACRTGQICRVGEALGVLTGTAPRASGAGELLAPPGTDRA
ncbi:MAG TPA: archaetidylserine decarboxylase [Steroidobacteraceae bacterium]|jgi:phosphatidylserine decarboxylase|nr:archaetidylserine decarboxylase [Steroidobacteraceae bacterium]